MAVDTSIYSNLLARPKTVAEFDAEAVQGQSNRLALQMNQAKMGEYQRGIEQENALADAYKNAAGEDGTIDRNKLYSGLAQSGLGAKLPAVQKGFADQDKALLESHKAKLENGLKQYEAMTQLMSGVKDQASYDAARQQAVAIMGPEVAANIPPVYDPAAVEAGRIKALSVKDQMEQHWKDITAKLASDKFAYDQTNDKANRDVTIRGQDKSAASSRYSADSSAKTAANRLGFDKEQAAAENAPDTTTQQEKELWLHTYTANNGQMPRSAPPSVRKYIGTWAAEMGITPNDLSSGAAKAKFDQAMAVTAGHRGGNMASVEATMPALVENAQTASHKLGQGKFVPLNQLMQMADDKISDPKLAEFKVAHMAVVSEYQQVISRGGTNVTALNEAMHVLNGARSVEAYDAAMNMVKKEVAINVAGSQAVRAGLGAGGHGPAPAAVGSGGKVINFGDL